VTLVEEVAGTVGIGDACDAIALSRATFYRLRDVSDSATHPIPTPKPHRRPGTHPSLTGDQEDEILALLNSERFLDCSPRQMWATLLDEGVYQCSWRTMYRLLHQHQAVRERRKIRRHPVYVRPELSADGPNQVWTWDITYLKGPNRGEFFYLYVVMDLFSRLITGWMLADQENGELAVRLLERSYQKHGVKPGQLTVHADRGAPMKSKSLSQLLHNLDVRVSHSRPKVSNDNPFSEAGFKTLKYSADFPARFDSIADAQAFCRGYFAWYNTEHHHSGIALLTPAQLHYGEMKEVLARRQATLDARFALTPQQFRHGHPVVTPPPAIVYINRPAQAVCAEGHIPMVSAGASL
jgi:putative transposase